MLYREYRPSIVLARQIECYWTLTGVVALSEHTVYPDGCMDILFNFSEEQSFLRDRERISVIGSMTKPIHVQQTGRIDLLGVRFNPGGLAEFISYDWRELTDCTACFENFSAIPNELNVDLLADLNTESRIQKIEQYFLQNLQEARKDPFRVSIQEILISKGRVKVGTLGRQLGISPKTMHRKFTNRVGLSPKQLINIVRFRAIKEHLEYNAQSSLIEIADHFGFTDSAHLTHSFKQFAGISPTRFRDGLR